MDPTSGEPGPPGLRARSYATARDLLRLDLREQSQLLVHLVKWLVIGSVVGVLAGISSAVFLESLDWATRNREQHGWLLYLLPLAGLAVGAAYHFGAGLAARGNNLVIDEIHEPSTRVPRRMAPLVYAATVVTHLFGGSAGREGTAIQMSASLGESAFRRVIPIDATDRRLLLTATIAGGFGAVFGVPIAGCVFALEVQSVGRVRHGAIVPALTASVVGDLVVRGLGVPHLPVPMVGSVDLDPGLAVKIIVAGLAFAVAAIVFAELTHGLRRVFAASIRWPPLRPAVGGVVIIALVAIVGTRDYLGLSLPLVTDSFATTVTGGATVAAGAFALKLLFTAVTLGSGFQGGEVTPLFVIGATLGATLGHALDAPIPLFAALGLIAVFAGATNTPIACTVMGVELFGAGAIVPLAMVCVIAYTFTSHRGIYGSQRVADAKADGLDAQLLTTLSTIAEQRRPWLPDRLPGRGRPPAPR